MCRRLDVTPGYDGALRHAASALTDQRLTGSLTGALPPCRQLGIVEFGPLKPYFLEVHAGAVGALPTLPGELPLSAHLDRGWSSDGGSAPPSQPALVRRRRTPRHRLVLTRALGPASPGWSSASGWGRPCERMHTQRLPLTATSTLPGSA